MNTIFEQIGGTYVQKDGYLYPNIVIPEEDMQPIGKYGRMRKRYLKEHRPVVYSQLIVSGNLFSHLREIDSTCNARMEQVVKQMAKAENVTESLKAENQLEWVARMNGIQNRAEEIVLQELIYE
jgi:hypothetical protein